MMPMNLRIRIILPVVILAVVGFALFSAFIYTQNTANARYMMTLLARNAEQAWQHRLADDIRVLRAEARHIVKTGFPDRAAADWPAFAEHIEAEYQEVKNRHGITHFNIITPAREVLLRVHYPARQGDRIERQSLLQAETTGKEAWGLESGTVGLFTLRYVTPWVTDGHLMGYLELGKEIGILGRDLAQDLSCDLLFVIHKDQINRQQYDSVRPNYNFASPWDEYDDVVVVARALTQPPDILAELAGAFYDATPAAVSTRSVAQTTLLVSVTRLPDAGGNNLARLIMVRDVTDEALKQNRHLIMTLLTAAIAFAVILAFLWLTAGRTQTLLAENLQGLAHSEEKFRKAFRSTPQWVNLTTLADDRYLDVNETFLQATGYSRSEVIGHNVAELDTWVDLPRRRELISQLQNEGHLRNMTVQRRNRSGAVLEMLFSAELMVLDGEAVVIAISQDITRYKHLEAQLQQAQKMEVVGRLAGGVAHDFNNLLSIITGYAEMCLMEMEERHPLYARLLQIREAGIKAGGLTRQLLTFSRQQVVAPETLSLNGIVSGIEKMLRRLIGEDIVMETVLADDLWPVNADPGQLEQVLMNLAVNARDAMPTGGRLTIETRNLFLDADYAETHLAITAGEYVLLAVSDTGCGMDSNTLAHIFEPFFTTKAVDKGTGLGLATVYGIVQQSGGHILVYSEVGQGTIFKIYLPRTQTESATAPSSTPVADLVPRGSGETILLVEDDESVRKLARQILEQNGYTVISFHNGSSALTHCQNTDHPVDLVLTDVIMPGMSGRALVEQVQSLRPGIKILYMSGYTDDAIVRHGVLTSDVCFMQKPFTTVGLTRKVREVLLQEGKP